jgi:hypothetical protein
MEWRDRSELRRVRRADHRGSASLLGVADLDEQIWLELQERGQGDTSGLLRRPQFGQLGP